MISSKMCTKNAILFQTIQGQILTDLGTRSPNTFGVKPAYTLGNPLLPLHYISGACEFTQVWISSFIPAAFITHYRSATCLDMSVDDS